MKDESHGVRILVKLEETKTALEITTASENFGTLCNHSLTIHFRIVIACLNRLRHQTLLFYQWRGLTPEHHEGKHTDKIGQILHKIRDEWYVRINSVMRLFKIYNQIRLRIQSCRKQKQTLAIVYAPFHCSRDHHRCINRCPKDTTNSTATKFTVAQKQLPRTTTVPLLLRSHVLLWPNKGKINFARDFADNVGFSHGASTSKSLILDCTERREKKKKKPTKEQRELTFWALSLCYMVTLFSWNCNAIQVSPKIASWTRVGFVKLFQEVSRKSFKKSRTASWSCNGAKRFSWHVTRRYRTVKFAWNKFHKKVSPCNIGIPPLVRAHVSR